MTIESPSEASVKIQSNVWGLTGGVASGKSEVARLLKAAGIPVIDADQVSHGLSQPGGAAHEEILKRFGTADRAKLREIVFADNSARKDLESILHPLIVAESERLIAAATSSSPSGKGPVIYEAALLVETGRYRQFRGLIVVDAPAHLRRARLISRDGVAPSIADGIIAAQMGDDARMRAATDVILNRGTLEELRVYVGKLIALKSWA